METFELKCSDSNTIFEFDDAYQLAEFIAYYYRDAATEAAKNWQLLEDTKNDSTNT